MDTSLVLEDLDSQYLSPECRVQPGVAVTSGVMDRGLTPWALGRKL